MNNQLSSFMEQLQDVGQGHVDKAKTLGRAALLAIFLQVPVDTDAHLVERTPVIEYVQIDEDMEQQALSPIDQLKQGLSNEEQMLADHLMTLIPAEYKNIVQETISYGLQKYSTNPHIKQIMLMRLSDITQHLNNSYRDEYMVKNINILSLNNGQNGAIFAEIGNMYSNKEKVLESVLYGTNEQSLRQTEGELNQSKTELTQNENQLNQFQIELNKSRNQLNQFQIELNKTQIELEKNLEELKSLQILDEQATKSFVKTLGVASKQFDRAMKTDNMHVFYNSPEAIKTFVNTYKFCQENNIPLPANFATVLQDIQQRNLIK